METVDVRGSEKHWSTEAAERATPTVREDDFANMRRMGKEQQFRRNFNAVTITSFCVAAMMGFVFIPINFSVLIELAGTGGTIVIYLANFAGNFFVVASLAEMSSIAPTAGGQYHWTSEFAPRSLQRFLSYISGWLSSLAWATGVASAMFIIGNLIPALISLEHPNFVPHAWQGYLFVVLTCIICFLINGFFARHLPFLEKFVIVFTGLAFIVLVAVPLALSPKLTGAQVFQTFGNNIGSTGMLEIMSAQILIYYSLLGSDSTAHMAEETEHAAIVIPRAMISSYLIVGIACFITLIAYCFCWVDPDAYESTPSGYPFLAVFITATGSARGAIGLTSIMILLIFFSVTNYMATTSRQIFAFARDDGLPFRNFVAKVNLRTLTPINALFVVFLFVVLICLIELGSTVAFNAIVSLQAMALAGTYECSILCLIWRRLAGEPLPPAPWSLGWLGLPVNCLGVLYGLYILAYAIMPSIYPVTAADFNYAPVMFVGVIFLSLVYYVIWGKRYQGPVVHVAKD